MSIHSKLTAVEPYQSNLKEAIFLTKKRYETRTEPETLESTAIEGRK